MTATAAQTAVQYMGYVAGEAGPPAVPLPAPIVCHCGARTFTARHEWRWTGSDGDWVRTRVCEIVLTCISCGKETK